MSETIKDGKGRGYLVEINERHQKKNHLMNCILLIGTNLWCCLKF